MTLFERWLFWRYTKKRFPIEAEYIVLDEAGSYTISRKTYSVDPVTVIRVHLIAGRFIGEVRREGGDVKFYLNIKEFKQYAQKN